MNKVTQAFYRKKSKTTIKGLLLLFVMLLINTQASWGQASENFSNIPTASSTSYNSRSWTGTNSVTWTATLARTDQTLNGKAICTNGSGTVTSPTYSGGIGTLQFNYVRGFTGTNARSIDVYVNNVKQGSTITVNTSSDVTVAYSSTINISGDVILELRTSGAQIKIDDISWTSYSALTTPTLSADVTSNTVDNNIDITFTDDSAWRAAVTAVKIGATTLTSATDYDLTAGNLQLKPSGLNVLLTASGSKAITVVATGYTDATVTQVVNAGAPTTNSTATISAALAPNTSRTITCTAKDQYSNLVLGYTFAYDVTIINNTGATAESYTIDDSPFTATDTNGNPVTATTNASGIATFTAVLPATIDPSDGLSIQVQLNNDTTNISSAFAFTQLAAQTITFGGLTPVTYGGSTFDLIGTASSGLTVSYASSNTAVATVSGSTVTIVGAGSTNITASQAGNGSYNAATNVIQGLTVNAIALTLSNAAATSRAYNTLLTTTITGTLTGVINSDNVTLIGTGTFADPNVANGIAVTANCTLAGTKAVNYTLTQPTGLTANITQASQTITFGALVNKTTLDLSFSLSATISSTLAITYVSSNETVATVSGSTVTIVGAGSTTITASQIGDANYTAASPVSQVLLVNPVLYLNQFTGVSACPTNGNVPSVSTNVSGTPLTRNTITCATIANLFNSTTLNNTASVNDASYIEFSITASSGYRLNLTSLSFYRQGSSTAPNSLEVRYSTDGFTTSASWGAAPVTPATGTVATWDFADFSSENAATVTFRIYPFGIQRADLAATPAAASTGTFRLDDVTINGTVTAVTTWTTSWSNGTPDITKEAIINGTYNTNVGGVQGPFTTKKLTVNVTKSLTINSGTNLTVQNDVINNGTLIVENNANLIQVNDVVNTGAITVNRNSNALKRGDYTLWSSPVTGSQTLLGFSPLTVATRFYTYDNTQGTTGLYSAITSPSITTFTAGTGYLIRMPNTDPTLNYDAGTGTLAYAGSFTGTPNNGDLTLGSVTPLTSDKFYAVGNPYPSTINAVTFLATNSTDGVLYFWRKTNGVANTASAYATWTTLGTAGSSVAPNNVSPDGTIAIGQGFIVKTGASATTLSFTNAMRTGNSSAPFFKTKEPAQKDRLWLNLTNTAGSLGQALIGYVEGATKGVDNGIDGKYINDSPIALTSNINNEEYTIQGRPAFDPTDVVALNFKTDVAGDYTIAIDHVDGLFSGSQDIYLVDSKTGTETNLKLGSYAFTAAAVVDNARFSLKYQKTLSLEAQAFTDNSVIVYKKNDVIFVNAGAKTINSITVFDIQGRVLAERNNVKANATSIQNMNASNQILIVKVTTNDNQIISKKVEN